MKRRTHVVVCEPFTLDDAQVDAFYAAAAGEIAARIESARDDKKQQASEPKGAIA